MGYATNIGKYRLGRTIGEGSFAKVKNAVDTTTGKNVAVKIIDKQMIIENKIMYQVPSTRVFKAAFGLALGRENVLPNMKLVPHQSQRANELTQTQPNTSSMYILFNMVKREISTMKLLHHPNIVRINEVIATKTKIYIVMEYVAGGQLSDKMAYLNRLREGEARKYFQQLIDAVEYCHCRGAYHRDLKPENLLLDSKGNLKVSDFGFSILRKPGDLLSTTCGSPSYVAPELIANKNYDGAAADVWSCGIILFELLAGYLPFEDRNIMNLYRKITRVEYTCPEWFTESQRKLISRILDPLPSKRMSITEILEDEWFQIDYKPSAGIPEEESINLDDINAAFDNTEGHNPKGEDNAKSTSFINAFQLIAMSNDLDLSGLFDEQGNNKQKTRIGSEHSITETIEKIEVAAKDASLSVQRMNNSKVKLHETKMKRCRSHYTLSAEVIEVAPDHCVVEISKFAGEIRVYKEV